MTIEGKKDLPEEYEYYFFSGIYFELNENKDSFFVIGSISKSPFDPNNFSTMELPSSDFLNVMKKDFEIKSDRSGYDIYSNYYYRYYTDIGTTKVDEDYIKDVMASKGIYYDLLTV